MLYIGSKIAESSDRNMYNSIIKELPVIFKANQQKYVKSLQRKSQ